MHTGMCRGSDQTEFLPIEFQRRCDALDNGEHARAHMHARACTYGARMSAHVHACVLVRTRTGARDRTLTPSSASRRLGLWTCRRVGLNPFIT